MKPIRHLIAIVFLLCGLTARGSERGYDHDDMVTTFRMGMKGGLNFSEVMAKDLPQSTRLAKVS